MSNAKPPKGVILYNRNLLDAHVVMIQSNDKTLFSIRDGRFILGPDVTWDEAARAFLDALERQIKRPIVAVDRPVPQGGDADG